MDQALRTACQLVIDARAQPRLQPTVEAFFDAATFTVSYHVADPNSAWSAVIDSVLDFDAGSGRISTGSADRIIQSLAASHRDVAWHLETHAHADHLSAAPYMKQKTAGQLAIGRGILQVQTEFGDLFNTNGICRGAAEFDRLFDDGEQFHIGELQGHILHVPGHTPADVAFVIGDAVFVGDTLFMPDSGTARADFPGGDAGQLYSSIRRLLDLPGETRVFICHDYKAPGRDHYAWETTIAEQRTANIHIRDGVEETAFVAMRMARDATLSMPKLFLPAVQVNIHGGRLPAPESNGRRYIKIPLEGF